jgi:hypothetical protein
VQGRVFAARSLLLQSASAIAVLIAGLLADNVFVPALNQRSRRAEMFRRGTIYRALNRLRATCATKMLPKMRDNRNSVKILFNHISRKFTIL